MKKYQIALTISLVLLNIFSIIFIAFFHIPYGKTIFYSLFLVIIIVFFFIDMKIEKDNDKNWTSNTLKFK